MDGRARKMKAATADNRSDSIDEKFERLHGYTLDGGGAFTGQGKGPDRSVRAFPLPPMSMRQFYGSLISVGVEIVE